MSRLFLEAESFDHLGGWFVDSQSFEELHSAYVMAHGLGVPVQDARTNIEIPEDGTYAVYVRTRDWTAVWDVKDPAGKFQLQIDGCMMTAILGTYGRDWAWQKAGEQFLSAGSHTLSLHDLTGFNGRADAIYLTTEGDVPGNSTEELDELRRTLGGAEVTESAERYELIVAGGGIAGICAALSASRLGVKTLLIHDRSVLGGCNSSEVRVNLGGQINRKPYPNLGDVVKEIAPIMGLPSLYDASYYEDARKAHAFEVREGGLNAALLLNSRVTETECEKNGQISSVVVTNVLSGKRTRFRAPLFIDATGDATLARAAGCETMYGREARSAFNESLAPLEAEKLVMGHSLRWYSEEREKNMPFPDIDWNMGLTDSTCLNVKSGDWEQETGFRRDMVHETEYIRDYGLRAILSNWAYQKNHYKNKADFARSELQWISPMGGKRESCRIVGEHILTQNDMVDHVIYEDASAVATWTIDMHFPEPDNDDAFPEPFRSFAYHLGIHEPYPVPYRCMVPKGVSNLLLAGRILSCTHVAFSSIRVMRTLGALGEVAGMAAAVCREKQCSPLEVYSKYLDALKEKMEAGVPIPQAFECACADEEAYHFKDIGWLFLRTWNDDWYVCNTPERMDKYMRGIERLGLAHVNPMPEDMQFGKTDLT